MMSQNIALTTPSENNSGGILSVWVSLAGFTHQ